MPCSTSLLEMHSRPASSNLRTIKHSLSCLGTYHYKVQDVIEIEIKLDRRADVPSTVFYIVGHISTSFPEEKMMFSYLFALLTTAVVIALPEPNHSVSRRQDDNGPAPGWEVVGCHTDSAPTRALFDDSFADPDMTPALCTRFCERRGFGFAGVEFGFECYCGFVIQATSSPVDSEECAVPCGGDSGLNCGAGNRIFIFTNGQPAPSAPEIVNTWQLKGCFSDVIRGVRTLLRRIEIELPVAAETCTAGCKSEGHRFAGLEFGGECWCGDFAESGFSVPSNECAMTCVGDRSQICGGPNRLTIYEDTDFPAVDPAACLQTTRLGSNLRAVPKGVVDPTPIALQAVDVGAVAETHFILSECTSCTSEWGLVDLNESVAIIRPALEPFHDNLQSFTANAGDAPVFFNSETHTQSLSQFCTLPNPGNALSPLLSPLALGVFNDANSWALCPNTTADGRLDVVYAPVEDNPHYDIAECQDVVIEVIAVP
ncbi:WSC-domain-containing protein [Coprinopsis marcescibilis]|uniref:WSC-domain-containing protein n=1 Tax=Coprinopsis marcescibilis TaxID=230819 RepID=A0A5C3KMI3_COPMA|nr:WSC-domain-containing protein [Coprinopsis marcescibilis]